MKTVRAPNRVRGRSTKLTAGFTLLEVLVAVGVFAVFSALAYGSLTRMLDTQERIEAERRFWRELALAFTQIEDDLAVARGRTVRNVFGTPLPAFRGQPTDTREQGDPTVEFTRGGVFVLGEARRADLQRVGYRLLEGRLLRLTWPELDQPVQTRPLSAALLEQVTELRMRFYAPNGGWVDVWPPGGQLTTLPAAVEVSLTIEGRGQFQRILRVNG